MKCILCNWNDVPYGQSVCESCGDAMKKLMAEGKLK